MRPALLVITDGRLDCLRQAIASAETQLVADWAQRILVNDAADADYQKTLETEYPDFVQVHHPERRGLSGAIRSGWAALDHDIDWIFHLEDDWVFPHPVSVDTLAGVCADIGAWQVALKRQPVNPAEIARGDFMDDRYQNAGQTTGRTRRMWVRSGFGFTLNPSIYPRTTAAVGWPQGGGEAEFTARLRQLDDRPFAIYGTKNDPPRCIHIGHTRTPSWQL